MFFRPSSHLDVTTAFAELKKDSLYNLSIALYASALLKDKEHYRETLSAIQKILADAPNNSFKAWMLGRVALAATHIEDKSTVEETLPLLKALLKEKEVTKDEFYAWALGYLAAVSPAEYKENQEGMLKAASTLTKPADALWAHVMNLQAAAKADDKPTFYAILQQMKTFTSKATVAEALTEIPASDWQAWALGITVEASAMVGDRDLYEELNQPLATAIVGAVKAHSTANAMLAQINATAASALMLQKSLPKYNPFH